MFTKHPDNPIIRFKPSPNADAAHNWLLVGFQVAGHPFGNYPFTNLLKGNMGEAFAHMVGKDHDFNGWQCDTANAHAPFSAISTSGIDLLWILDSDELTIVLQEVKTSSDKDLQVVANLVADYRRLFGTNLRLTLQTRLQSVAYKLEHFSQQPVLANRIRALGVISPATSTSVKLVPTVIHSSQSVLAKIKLVAVRTTLVADGWQSVTPWVISLPNLDNRMKRLSQGL